MKPFRDQCNEVARRGYVTAKGNEVKPIICEEQIWFEASLNPNIAVGKCKHEKHNPVYRKINDAK